MQTIRLITLAPGHFHAALMQKQMTPGISRRCRVYGPLDADTVAHLDRLAAFNSCSSDPTSWEVDLHAGANWLDRFLREQVGNVVVLSGRNRPKIDLMLFAVRNSLHVVADKPWVVDPADFPKIEELFREAELREVLTWDMMTERHEVTNRLQRKLIRDADIFGGWQSGSPEVPVLRFESVHHLKKSVAGRPLVRPRWWFDPAISGEAMADVGTHLADLSLWMVAPEQVVDYRTDITFHRAERWPLMLSEQQFRAITGLSSFPASLAKYIDSGQLRYFGNNSATYSICDVPVEVRTRWEYEAPQGGGDTHQSVARGNRAIITVRQATDTHPEVFVSATDAADHKRLVQQLRSKCDSVRHILPGLSVRDYGAEAQFLIPNELRLGHEAHFANVMEEFVRYFEVPEAVPHWERPNTLAKYYLTTQAVAWAREND